MILTEVFSPRGIKTELESETKDELFEELAHFCVEVYDDVSLPDLLAALHAREEKCSTGIKRGIAIPHAVISGITEPRGIVGVSKEGIEYDSLDGELVHIVFMLVSPPSGYDCHLRVLQRLAELLHDPAFITAMYDGVTGMDIYDTLCRFDKMFAGIV